MTYVITAQNDNVPCPGWVIDIVTRQRKVFRLHYGRNSSLNDHEVFQVWDYCTSLQDGYDIALVMAHYEEAKIDDDDLNEMEAIVAHMPRMNFQGEGHPA